METTGLGMFLLSTICFTWRARNPPQIPYQPYATLGRDEFTIEVCLSDIESAQEAVRGGCTSIEVCSDRPQGGVTPSYGLVEELVARYKNTVEIHCLVRPRPGNFDYTDNEFDVMLRDVKRFKSMGVDGVVVGMLTSNGKHIDIARMKVMREASRGMMLTFHRAFDVLICSNSDVDERVMMSTKQTNGSRSGSMESTRGDNEINEKYKGNWMSCESTRSTDHHLRVIVDELECDRLLTSGQASSALKGKNTLLSISRRLKERMDIKIIAAAGVNTKNVREIIISTRVDGVHAGSAMCNKMYSKQGGNVYMGKKPTTIEGSWQHEPDGESWEATDQTKVGEFCSEISKALIASKN